jgi:hypothetical protein
MKTKISLIILLLIGTTLFFGCTTTNNPQTEDEKGLLDEVDSTWIDETGLSMENPIATEEDAIAAETGTEIISETEEINIGEMI